MYTIYQCKKVDSKISYYQIALGAYSLYERTYKVKKVE